jgi:hypothetical protein
MSIPSPNRIGKNSFSTSIGDRESSQPNDTYRFERSKGNPGTFVRIDHSVPPAVTNKVFMSAPPNPQFVVSSRGIGIKSIKLPWDEKT